MSDIPIWEHEQPGHQRGLAPFWKPNHLGIVSAKGAPKQFPGYPPVVVLRVPGAQTHWHGTAMRIESPNMIMSMMGKVFVRPKPKPNHWKCHAWQTKRQHAPACFNHCFFHVFLSCCTHSWFSTMAVPCFYNHEMPNWSNRSPRVHWLMWRSTWHVKPEWTSNRL